MLQRLLGVSIGALITFAILWFSDFTNQTDLIPWYFSAVLIGAITSFFWPVVAGIWLGRRARARRDERIENEVQRQLAEERKQS